MRLELEQNPSHSGYAGDIASDVENRATEAANHLREGIRAAQSGNRSAARTALLRAAELDPQSESAWMWLSSISEYPEELLAFLTNVLEINPRNTRALEWSAATKALLAKNLVQRGIDAAEANQKDLATQHFNQALEYDEKNSMAWLWLASQCESNEGRLSYLEKVLEFDPENETARAGYKAARDSIREGLLAEARAAAVAGDSRSANELLDAVIAEEPDAEDAWVLKSHIAVSFEEKIAAFRRVLEINPENNVARAGLESLTAIMDAVGVKPQRTEDQDASVAGNKPKPVSLDRPQPEEAFETIDDEGVVETVWNGEAQERRADEKPLAAQPSSPFDSYAEEPKVDFNGTMLMTKGDLGFTFDEDSGEVNEESPVYRVDNLPSVDREPDLHRDEQPADFESEAVSYRFDAEEPINGQPASAAEPEEITYELAAEEPGESKQPTLDDGVRRQEEFAQLDRTDELPVLNVSPEFAVEDAIAPPTTNPFESEAFRNEPSAYDTVISAFREDENETSPDPKPVQSSEPGDTAFNVPFDRARYAGTIPMPGSGLEQFDPFAHTNFETRIVQPAVEAQANSTAPCPFCKTENDAQAIACNGCLAVLTLADLELVLANHHADKDVVRRAVEQMEREKASRELTESELTTLGIGHLNLRNLQFGYNYLHEAAQKNPNNVVLSSQANWLLIRLEEIKQQHAAHEAMSKGKTILVVDDSPTVRKLIAGKLEKCGHEVFCSGDGVEAMEQLASLRPDLILLDITMPRMDGYQVCKLIRGNPEMKNTPVVMISGKDGFFDKVRGRMAGCSGYITKPFGPETLMKAVESYLSPVH